MTFLGKLIRTSLMVLFFMMMAPSIVGTPSIEQLKMPVYDDEENARAVLERLKNDPEALKAYKEAIVNKEIWTKLKLDEYKHDNTDKTDIALGTMYSVKDFRVKKTYEKDLQVAGGTIDVVYHPIDPIEKAKMAKTYRTVHLDGIEMNCESLMPRGSEGFAILTLYDERFTSQEKGFLGLVGFPLSHGVSKATLKVNYSISTEDSVNWVAVITVYDHNLRDNMRPCNFHLKAFYKYTNNVRRFLKNVDETEVGTFKIQIQKDKRGFAEESIRNSLDYSMSVLTNKKFMKKLSGRELECLRRCGTNDIERGRQIPNYETSCSYSVSEGKQKALLDRTEFRREFDSSQASETSGENELKINFENMGDEEKEKFLVEQLNALTMKGKFINKPKQLKM
uniref:Movement protein n=1 Tax=Apple rubbery wood virus 2 TaxID=2164103 RepID=A0A2S1B5E5_9VIRU|nr:movement protein [Apple rubbery wood virus 2]